MKSEHHNTLSHRPGNIARRRSQRGAVTIFIGVFVLILMTLMLVYATRVGVFEQRISANENRQKIAFHAAETALSQAMEYLLANRSLAVSSNAEAGPDGNTTTPGFRAGWFLDDTTTRRWQPCTTTLIATAGHPCGGDVAAAAGSFYYDDPATTDTSIIDSIPINTGGLAANTTARATATVCILDPDDPTAACDTNLPDPNDDEGGVLLVTLMAYGYSDCTDITVPVDPATCKGAASVSLPLTNLSNVAGGAGVPLVSKNTLPLTGTPEIVVNPNAGGIGVPVSVWANGRPSGSPPTCPGPVDSDGIEAEPADYTNTSWATCQYHEWFGTDYWPDPLECPTASCKCDTSELISGAKDGGGGSPITIETDIQVDPLFPCDLFEFYFGVPRSQYALVKSNAEVYTDCSSLNESSSGFIWISGPTCLINSNTVIGSEENPVMLVLASAFTDVRGGAIIYGTLFITEAESSGAAFEANGGMTVFGQVIVDSLFVKLQGTFQVVYDEGIINKAAGAGGLGILNHGWRDWGLPDIAW
jgi:hypothetical protein